MQRSGAPCVPIEEQQMSKFCGAKLPRAPEIVSKTGVGVPGEPLITLRIFVVAACCSRVSASSRLSSSTD